MDDPVAMWLNLKTTHRSQIANSRYHVMQKLLSIHKDDTESLMEYFMHINSATNDLIGLAPSSLAVSDIVNEIGIHAVISGLDQAEYGAFTSYDFSTVSPLLVQLLMLCQTVWLSFLTLFHIICSSYCVVVL
jgi:hypothetical protein